MLVQLPQGRVARIWAGGVTLLERPRGVADHAALAFLKVADVLDPELGRLGSRWRTMTGRRELAAIKQNLRTDPMSCAYPWHGPPPTGA